MSPFENPRSAEAILDRLRKVLNVKSDADLARVLGVGRAKVSKWKTRDSRPYPECLQVAEQTGVCLEWILTGEGQMHKPQVQEARGAFEVPALAVSQSRVSNLLAMLASLPAGEQERVMGELQARAEDAQQIAELKAAVESIRQCKGERAA